MATSETPNPETETGVENAHPRFTTNSQNSSSSINVSNPSLKGPSIICLYKFAGDAFTGALMGSLFGYGSGLVSKKGLKRSFLDAGSSAKTFGVLSGVHSLVLCFLKLLRGKDDAINAGLAGCCTGLALSVPGTPQSLLQNCLTFGAFTLVFEGLSVHQKKPTLAHSIPVEKKVNELPHLAFPLPNELKRAFVQFQNSLRKFTPPSTPSR